MSLKHGATRAISMENPTHTGACMHVRTCLENENCTRSLHSTYMAEAVFSKTLPHTNSPLMISLRNLCHRTETHSSVNLFFFEHSSGNLGILMDLYDHITRHGISNEDTTDFPRTQKSNSPLCAANNLLIRSGQPGRFLPCVHAWMHMQSR